MTAEKSSLLPLREVTLTEEQAVALIDLLGKVKNALHAHELKWAFLTPEKAGELRHEIERTLR